MNPSSFIAMAAILAGSLGFAQGEVKDTVRTAAKQLAAKDNYCWTTTTEVPESARWRPGPVHGRTAKNGPTVAEMTYGETSTHLVIHGDKKAITNRDGDWESLQELENSEGGGRFRATILRNYMTPAEEVLELVEASKALTESDGVIVGALSEDGAKARMLFRRRGGGGGPEIFDAEGSVKFWMQDGQITKYQYHVKGVMDWNGNDVDIDRAVTVQIKDVGTTQVEIPEAAKQKLS